jgi:hypothetical protein
VYEQCSRKRFFTWFDPSDRDPTAKDLEATWPSPPAGAWLRFNYIEISWPCMLHKRALYSVRPSYVFIFSHLFFLSEVLWICRVPIGLHKRGKLPIDWISKLSLKFLTARVSFVLKKYIHFPLVLHWFSVLKCDVQQEFHHLLGRYDVGTDSLAACPVQQNITSACWLFNVKLGCLLISWCGRCACCREERDSVVVFTRMYYYWDCLTTSQWRALPLKTVKPTSEITTCFLPVNTDVSFRWCGSKAIIC